MCTSSTRRPHPLEGKPEGERGGQSWRPGRSHAPEGNSKVREEAEDGNREGQESTMTPCWDGETIVVRGSGNAA
jgi:hypothetical protein